MKKCKDCKFSKRISVRGGLCYAGYDGLLCMNPNANKENDMSSGRDENGQPRPQLIETEYERAFEYPDSPFNGNCGPKAKHFEQKEKTWFQKLFN